MVLDAAKARYAVKAKHEFKLFHWWKTVHHQPKWSVKYGGDLSIDVSKRSCLGVSGEHSSSRDIEEEVSRPMGHDRIKTTVTKEKDKRKAGSSS